MGRAALVVGVRALPRSAGPVTIISGASRLRCRRAGVKPARGLPVHLIAPSMPARWHDCGLPVSALPSAVLVQWWASRPAAFATVVMVVAVRGGSGGGVPGGLVCGVSARVSMRVVALASWS